jgi:hypothetical protein
MSIIVEVPKEQYDELIEAQEKLSALEAAGVDNWEGYDDAMRMLHEGE